MEHFLDNVIQSKIDMDGYIEQFEEMLNNNDNICSLNDAIENGFCFCPFNHGCKNFEEFRKNTGIHTIVWKAQMPNINVTKEEFIYYLEFLLNVIQIPKYGSAAVSLMYNDSKIYSVLYRAIDEIGCEIISVEQGFYIVVKNKKLEIATDITGDVYDLNSALYLYTHSSYKDNLIKKADVLCRVYKYIESIRQKANQYNYSNLYDDISKLMDALDIRHYPNKRATETLNDMTKEELLEWYDQLFDLCVSLIILVDYSSKRKDIKELKSQL